MSSTHSFSKDAFPPHYYYLRMPKDTAANASTNATAKESEKKPKNTKKRREAQAGNDAPRPSIKAPRFNHPPIKAYAVVPKQPKVSKKTTNEQTITPLDEAVAVTALTGIVSRTNAQFKPLTNLIQQCSEHLSETSEEVDALASGMFTTPEEIGSWEDYVKASDELENQQALIRQNNLMDEAAIAAASNELEARKEENEQLEKEVAQSDAENQELKTMLTQVQEQIGARQQALQSQINQVAASSRANAPAIVNPVNPPQRGRVFLVPFSSWPQFMATLRQQRHNAPNTTSTASNPSANQ